ncbi:hypothetical protein Ae406Ps2_5702 [Pseudonocardia sp. Ae406_Ps2]|uniref:hypothetical protein n=1 Tax=unclassified Pseudonocardia TaxID=2619320 RepID=UPI00094B0B01|nr:MULTISPECIES: hypothetical protein [unclassified Pseudonocardia]OLL96590.1 hypothetical protein Ae331Ps2_0257c [Pseudonocardia sp. Ae331_Ps2]OLM05702.1 hypothetical protein Ae406Ps2_5702 [Pseudonocardia sp. Ae406_Ps2]OLM15141.1 hypothetical protein Ae505Ps2_5273c [Pseudonocardia sp. Ae505_Ps2]OLM27278.1 hypothetical protein Ae706Ps2_5712 [Pseudonocardia sp. Ae706_Ps2]OLM30446.1 hypothetical protein Ae717Ps2_1341 [Pseudonocardia sp. Ae717_Ps2]
MTDPAAGPGPQAVADAVLAHPSVLRLDGGPFGAIASYLPGHRVQGVRLADPVEIAVVLRLGRPFAEVADEVADRVRAVLGDDTLAVDVTVAGVGAAGGVEGPAAP